MLRVVAYGVAGLIVLVALLLTLAYVFQRRLIYLPTSGPVPAARDVLPGATDVSFPTADGLRLNAWFVPATWPDRRGVTVLVAPGNAGDRSLRAPLADALSRRGLSVLLLDYRGYGANPGDPTEAGLALDVRAARRFLVDELRVRPDRLIYYGESLGAAVVTELATEHPSAGLLLCSPFVDLASVASAVSHIQVAMFCIRVGVSHTPVAVLPITSPHHPDAALGGGRVKSPDTVDPAGCRSCRGCGPAGRRAPLHDTQEDRCHDRRCW